MLFDHLPSERAERWQLMQAFLSAWYPLAEGPAGYTEAELQAAESRLGRPLPIALREWYLTTGKRREVWSRQDLLVPPADLFVQEEKLVIYVENQGVTRWGIAEPELECEDPPVIVDTAYAGGGWVQQSSTVSGFALEMLTFAVKFGSSNCSWANGDNNKEAQRLIEAHHSRIPFPDWHWPGYPTRFYGNDEIVIETNGEADRGWLWVTARTEMAFRTFQELIGPAKLEWSTSSDEEADGRWLP